MRERERKKEREREKRERERERKRKKEKERESSARVEGEGRRKEESEGTHHAVLQNVRHEGRLELKVTSKSVHAACTRPFALIRSVRGI